jgi:hypothetical protein
MKIGKLIEILKNYENNENNFYSDIEVYLQDKDGKVFSLEEKDIIFDDDEDIILSINPSIFASKKG